MSKPNKSSRAHLVEVDSDRAGQRLDNFLSGKLKGVPRSALYRMIRTGQVRINGGRCKAASRLEEGDKVMFTVIFRGRELARQDLGTTLLRKVATLLEDVAKVEKPPSMEGRRMHMTLVRK